MRPLPLTIICWLLIVLGAVGLLGPISMWAMRDSPEMKKAIEAMPMSLETSIALAVLGSAVMVVSGIAMMRGANWGRWLYVVYSVLAIAYGMYLQGMTIAALPGVVITAVIFVILFLPASSRYLTGQADPMAGENA